MSQTGAGFFHAYVDWIIRWRWLVIGLSIVFIIAIASGARHIEQSNTYRIFFAKNNPQLLATEALEAVYTKDDSQVFVVHNPTGSVYVRSAVEAILDLTEAGWQTPYSTRVDSLTNYQYSWADGDDLVIEDLIPRDRAIDMALLERARDVIRSDPAAHGKLVSRDGDTTLVAIRVELPEENSDASLILSADSRKVLETIREKYPNLRFELTGTGLLQAAFSEATLGDGRVIWPTMFVMLVLFLVIFMRSLSGALATFGVVVLSAIAGAGAIGYYGYVLNPVVVLAPIIILTLAIADSVHIISSLFQKMRSGSDKISALKRSMELNLKPVFLTSLTTMVGFLVMNFSDAPPFHHLGNVTATGVGIAWLLSMTFLPALISVLPVQRLPKPVFGERAMNSIASFTVANALALAVSTSVLFILLIAAISRIVINDFPHKYFDETSDFRRGTEFLENERGFFGFSMSVKAEGSGGINDPMYLGALERFESWLLTRPHVVHVSSYAQVVKKLNKNMHGDDPESYRIPDDRETAAQYLLLYEMSLPYGLDLNDMVNVDRTATKVDVLFQNAGLSDIKRVGVEAERWLEQNTAAAIPSRPASYAVMFAYIMESNTVSMLWGSALAFLLIGVILVVSLRSWVMGLASLVSNMVPIAAAMGIWALTVREVNFAVSVIAGISIGIVVDDTVHFLSKYAHARQQLAFDAGEAVRYAFTNVGPALLRTSIIIVGGFAVLTLSSFWVTVVIGALMSLTVVCALVADFLLLPALLILFDREESRVPESVHVGHSTIG